MRVATTMAGRCLGWTGVFAAASLVAVPTGTGANEPAQVIRTNAQIEADWLRQDIIRTLPPSPRRRPQAKITTRQDATGGCDGIKNGRFGFHTSRDPSPWWQVDLGRAMPLERIVIYNRCDTDRAGRLEVVFSDDGKSWTPIYRHDGSKFQGHTDGKPLVVQAEAKSAKFVRLQLPPNRYLHLDEVEVYAVGRSENVALRRPADQSSVSNWSTSRLGAASTAIVIEEPVGKPAYPAGEVVERGLALAENLRISGVDVVPHVQVLEDVARALQALPQDAPPSSRRDLYFKARWTQRRMSLANPLLDFEDLLLVKRIPGTFTHMSDQYYGWWSRPGGGLYILEDFKTDTPRLRCLTDALPPGSVLRPDLSFDGTKVLFAHCRYYSGLRAERDKLNKDNVPEDAFYHLYEMNLDGTGLRRLTHGKYDDFDGRYLPNGEIVFLSTRRGQYIQCDASTAQASSDGAQPDCYVRCGGGPPRPVAVYTLHVMDTHGEWIRQISPFEMFEWTPSVDHAGRILYSRWDYVDRHNGPYMSLWSTLPDGTETRAVFGNYTTNPHCVFEPRAIPGSQKLVFTASAHHANTGGSLVLLDPNKAADGDAAMVRLSPEVAFPETEGWPKSYFANPWPLSEQHYLVAWSNREMIGWPGPPEPANAMGIYLYDAFGNLTLVYRDPTITSATPIPVRPRPRPPAITSQVAWSGPQVGQMMVLDVYRGLESIPRGSVRQLRLVGVPAKTHPTKDFPSIGITRDDPGKFVMGTVPVEEDGSAFFQVPSGVTLFLQALDKDGQTLQTMRSATYVQPGQTHTCIGCHESRNTSPPDIAPVAMTRPPSKITPGPDGSWPLRFDTLVEPVLKARCVSCHQPDAEAADFDLTTRKAYDSLLDYGKPSLREHVRARYLKGRSIAGACAASVNPVVKLLRDGHYDVELSQDDWNRLYTWMDTYGQRQGSFSPEQEELLRQLRQRMAALLRRAADRNIP